MKLYVVSDGCKVDSFFFLDKEIAVKKAKESGRFFDAYEIDANIIDLEKEKTCEEKLEEIKKSLIWYKQNPYANSFAFYDDVSNILGVA